MNHIEETFECNVHTTRPALRPAPLTSPRPAPWAPPTPSGSCPPTGCNRQVRQRLREARGEGEGDGDSLEGQRLGLRRRRRRQRAVRVLHGQRRHGSRGVVVPLSVRSTTPSQRARARLQGRHADQ